MQLIFATHNANKVNEVRSILGNKFDIVSLEEWGWTEEIPEPFDTLEENASEKSRVIWEKTHTHCFSEDTGLEVHALDGAPGVKSARYAGERRNFSENVQLLLKNLTGVENRTAQFRTVISLRINKQEFLFEGICKGEILLKETGSGGFGYDPVFVPEGANKSFAEMTMDEKNIYSHRRKAMDALIEFLQNYESN